MGFMERCGFFRLDGGFGKRPVLEFTARDTRQGAIVLRSRTRKALFVAGLAALCILGVFGLLVS